MSGKAIGVNLQKGFRGNVTRVPDCIITPYTNVGTSNSEFGEPVVFDATNGGVRKIKATDTSNVPVVGIAVRRIGQPYADSADGWYYKPGDIVDVLVRGSIAVELADDTGIAAGGKVYVCNGTYASRAAGVIVCADDSTNDDTIEIPGAVFAQGACDANDIAEITILTRSI